MRRVTIGRVGRSYLRRLVDNGPVLPLLDFPLAAALSLSYPDSIWDTFFDKMAEYDEQV
jgi:hypothetical protein